MFDMRRRETSVKVMRKREKGEKEGSVKRRGTK